MCKQDTGNWVARESGVDMVKTTVEIINRAGLHARAASKLAALTASFSSTIQIGHEKMVDGKSIFSLMMLEAVRGTTLSIEADGSDEEQALQAIVDLIQDRFGEDS